MPEDNDFLSIEDSLENIENVLGDINSNINADKGSDDFLSSDKAEFFETVKNINSTLDSVNSYFQNMETSNIGLQESEDEVSSDFQPEIVDSLAQINDTLIEIKSGLPTMSQDELIEKIQSAQQKVNDLTVTSPENSISITPEETGQLEQINSTFQSINQEIKTLEFSINDNKSFSMLKNSIAELQESISGINLNMDTNVVSELTGLADINWQEDLIQPLQQLRNLVEEPLVKDNITTALDGLESKNFNVDNIKELEQLIPSIANSFKEISLNPAVFQQLTELEERLADVKSSVTKSKNDYQTVSKTNDTMTETNSSADVKDPSFTTTQVDVKSADFRTESNEIGVVNETQTQPKQADSIVIEKKSDTSVSDDFVVEQSIFKQTVDTESTENPLAKKESTSDQFTQMMQLIQKQNEIITGFIEATKANVLSEKAESGSDEKPLMTYDNKDKGADDLNSSEMKIMFKQMLQLLSSINSNITSLSSPMPNKSKPLNLHGD